MTRDPFSGWSLDPDPLYTDEEPGPRRRFGCAWLALLLLAAVLAGMALPAPLSAETGTPAEATYCAPTPTRCNGWGGNAKLAAVHSFRFGDDPYWLRVSRGGRHVDVRVVSFCGCQNRDDRIDLSPSAFRVLADLSRGRINVLVRPIPEGPEDAAMREEVRDDSLYGGPTLPPTSTEDSWTP